MGNKTIILVKLPCIATRRLLLLSRGGVESYANDGKDNATGLPKYCSGQVNLINKSSILFGSYNGTWYYKTLVDTSNLEDTQHIGMKTMKTLHLQRV